MEDLDDVFEELEDPRTGNAKHHLLHEVLVIALCTILCGGETCADMALFGRAKRDFLQQFLTLPHGIASHDTFSRIFRLLDPARFHAWFVGFMQHFAEGCQGVVAIDGKTMRRSFDPAAQASVRNLIWNLYRDLKAYRCAPTGQRRAALRARFNRIFTRKTGFVALDRLLARLHANRSELLMVLERPEIPLHTNGSENDIRCHVTRRKVSGGTAARSGATVATPSSVSSRPALSSKSPSGIILVQDSRSREATPFRLCPNWSSLDPGRPERHAFCPSYLNQTQPYEIWSFLTQRTTNIGTRMAYDILKRRLGSLSRWPSDQPTIATGTPNPIGQCVTIR